MTNFVMNTAAVVGTAQVRGTLTYSEATHLRLADDALFYIRASRQAQEESERSRHARTTVLYTILYLMSAADLVLARARQRGKKNVWSKQKGRALKGTDKPEAQRHFEEAHERLTGVALSVDTSRVHDILLLRNQFLFHPPGTSHGPGHKEHKRLGLHRYDPSLTTLKEFGIKHAEEMLVDAARFVVDFCSAVAAHTGDASLVEGCSSSVLTEFLAQGRDA